MAIDAGAARVIISGDYSKLAADFAAAQGVAAAGAQAVGNATSTGFGRASGAAETLSASVREAMAAQEALVPTSEAAAAATAEIGKAAEHAVPQMAAMSGAIRTLSGEQSIRAVERFGASVLGLGAAAQAAFPLIGALAVGELFARVYERVNKVSEGEKQAAEEAKNYSSEIEDLEHKVASLQVTFETMKNGATAGIKAEIEETTGLVTAAAENLQKAREALRGGVEQTIGGRTVLMPSHPSSIQRSPEAAEVEKAGLELHAAQLARDVKLEELRKKREEEDQKAAAEAKRIANEKIAEVRRESESLKSAFEEELADLKSSHQVSAGEEESFWQNRLGIVDQWGGRYSELHREIQQKIGTLNQEEIRQKKEADKAALAEQMKDLEESGRIITEQIRVNAEEERAAKTAADQQAGLTRRQTELATQGQGTRAESDNEIEKLKAQQTYSLQIVHTKQQEIQYTAQMNAFEEKALQIKLGIAQLQLTQAIQENAVTKTKEGQLKVDEDMLHVEQAKDALTAKQITDQTKLTAEIDKQNLAKQLGADLFKTIQQAPQAIGGALASGIFGGGKHGEDVGKQVTKAVEGLGKKLLSDGFTMILTKLIEQILIQTGMEALLTAIFVKPSVLGTTFATGGPVNSDMVAQVHKGEYVLNANQVAGRAPLPDMFQVPLGGATGNYVTSTAVQSVTAGNSTSHSLSFGDVHVHGVQNTRQMMIEIADLAKNASPSHSPLSR